MTIASIDIGTNTVLLLIAEVDERSSIRTLEYQQRIPRLGKGVDASKNLHADAMLRVVGVLKEYKVIISQYRVDRIIVAGTSAVRDAQNKDEFAKLIKDETGFHLEILSGDDEALWTYRGAISGISYRGKATVVDIGGGSTEITVGDANEIQHSMSLNIGSVRLTERFLRHDPPLKTELASAITFVESELGKAAHVNFTASKLVGVAGTSTSLAVLAQGLKSFSIEAVTNSTLGFDTVEELFRTLRAMPSEKIRQLSSIMEGRSDVITAGALILREILAHFKFKEMIVSERGVRYGLVLREWEITQRH